MDAAHRHLARHDDDLAPLLEADIGRPQQQVIRVAADDAGHRLHAAGDDDHAVRLIGAARYRGRHIAVVVDDIGQRADLLEGVFRLIGKGHGRPLRDDQMCLHLRQLMESLEEVPPHDDTTGSRNPDNQSQDISLSSLLYVTHPIHFIIGALQKKDECRKRHPSHLSHLFYNRVTNAEQTARSSRAHAQQRPDHQLPPRH